MSLVNALITNLRNYFELLPDDDLISKPTDATDCYELSLNDIFLSHFSETLKSDLNLLASPLDIEPEYTLTELTETEMNTYRDFCGSQEWQFCQQPKTNKNKSNSTIEDSSVSSSSSLTHNNNQRW